jgi:hypothetical protein
MDDVLSPFECMIMKMIKNILRGTVLALILLVLVGGTVFAAYSYYANIQVLESDGNSYTYLPVIADVDNDYLSDNNYISLTGLDTRVLAGSTELKHLVADDKTLFVAPTVGANSTGNYKYTLNNTSDLDSFPVIVGYDGYITIPSEISDDMQLGDDFEIEFGGYVDTSSGNEKNTIHKPYAFRAYVSSDEEYKVTILDTGAATDTNLVPNAEGAYANITSVTGASTHWEAVDDPPATPDDNTSYVSTASSTQLKDAYNVEDGGIADYLTINSVTVYFRIKATGSAPAQAYGQPYLRLGGVETTGTEVGGNIDVWTTYNETLARPGGGSWETSDIDNLQVAIGIKAGGGDTAYLTQAYVVVNYTPESEVVVATLTGVSSDDYTVKAYADTSYLMLSLDGDTSWDGTHSARTALGGASVPDNANDIVINQNNVMPYFDYLKWTVSDTLIAWYQPISMIVGTTLDDREGTDAGETGTAEEDGVITWGANPAGVDAVIGSLVSSSQPEIAPATEDEAVDVLPGGEIPAGGTVDTATLEDNPMYFIVELLSENADLTEEQIWFGGATLIILLAMGIAVAKVPNHLLLAGTIGLVFSGFFTAMHIYQWWMLLIFGFVFVASILMERKPVI